MLLERWLNALWYGEDAMAAPVRWLASILLAPLALLYFVVTTLRSVAYRLGLLRQHRVAVPVVVIGNLSAGGTGKTPLVIWLAEALRDRGIAVGVVSRGYGRHASATDPPVLTVTAETSPLKSGDEPALIARATDVPVRVSSNRVAAARALAEQGVQLILCDDGLQHLALARDAEFVVVDGARGFGNGWCLPLGPLRESVARLRGVAAVVANGSLQTAAAAAVPDECPVMTMHLEPAGARNLRSGEVRTLASFAADRQVHALAGIGNPQRFFKLLRTQGIRVVEHHFADHHAFAAGDLAFSDAAPVLMTAKDAVKCMPFADARCWEVPVTATFAPPEAARLLEQVLALIPGPKSAQGARSH